jgi:predicted aspartyl protease
MSVQQKSSVRKSKLIRFDLQVKGSTISLRALLDTGATNNFISRKVLKEMGISPKRSPSHKEIRVRLANGSIVQVPLYIVKLHLVYGPYASIVEEKSAVAEISICSLIEPDSQSTIMEHEPKSDGNTVHVQVAKPTLE